MHVQPGRTYVGAVIAVLAIASLYELLVQALGLAWFWRGFSVCERAYLLVPLVALILAASGLFAGRVCAAPTLFSIALLSMMGGLLIAGAVEARAKFLCGAPIEAKYSPTFFVIGVALAIWSAYGLAVAIAKRSRT